MSFPIFRLINHAIVYLRTLFSDGPNYLIFFITARCNFRCSFCFYLEEIENADKERELTLDEIKKIAKSSPVLYHVTFTGGETFLRDDIDEIVKLFYQYSNTRSVTITTNGSYPERIGKMVEEMAKSCPNLIVRVPLSLDGFKEVHDQIRGVPGTWEKVLHTYDLFKYKINILHTVNNLVNFTVEMYCFTFKFHYGCGHRGSIFTYPSRALHQICERWVHGD